MQALALRAAAGAAMDERDFQALSGPAYRLAARILGSAEGAEDVVQQACLAAVERLRAAWRNAVALSWAPAGEEPRRARLRADGDVWTFLAGGRVARLEWSRGEQLPVVSMKPTPATDN